MSEIEKVLKTKESEDLIISNHDRIALCELLAMIGAALRDGKIWLNNPKRETQEPYIDLCERFSRQLANLKVNNEH